MAEDKKGGIEFQFLPQKFSKCPYCGSEIERYYNSENRKWEEEVKFKCGLRVQSKTPHHFEEYGICQKSKEWKKLVAKRLKELEKIKTYTNKILTDKKLIKELNEEYSTIESHIKNWWYN